MFIEWKRWEYRTDDCALCQHEKLHTEAEHYSAIRTHDFLAWRRSNGR